MPSLFTVNEVNAALLDVIKKKFEYALSRKQEMAKYEQHDKGI